MKMMLAPTTMLRQKRDADLHIRIPFALKEQLLTELAELQRRVPVPIGYADLVILKLAEPSNKRTDK